MAMPLADGNPIALVAGENQPYGVAVDESNVYWTSLGSGTVNKVSKCCMP